MGKFDNFDYKGYLNKAVNNYYTAINYYKMQKNNFMAMIQEASNEAFIKNGQKLLNTLSQEVDAQFETNNFGEKTKDYYNAIEKMCVNYLNSTKNGNILKSELDNFYNDKAKLQRAFENDAHKTSDNLKIQVEKILQQQQLLGLKTRIANTYKKIYGQQPEKVSISAGYGMFRRALINELIHQKYQLSPHSQGGYTKLLGGYYAEIAIANVFKKWAKNSSIKVLSIGGDTGKTDVAIGLNDIEFQLDELEKLSTKGNIKSDKDIIKNLQDQFTTFGVQSKSWGIPENKIVGRRGNYTEGFMSLGNHQALWSMLEVSQHSEKTPLRGFHYNAYEVSKHMIAAIGAANVLYRLKNNEMIWTYELIEQLMQKKYYLAFWFTHNRAEQKFEYPATTELAWQKVDNRMQYARNS